MFSKCIYQQSYTAAPNGVRSTTGIKRGGGDQSSSMAELILSMWDSKKPVYSALKGNTVEYREMFLVKLVVQLVLHSRATKIGSGNEDKNYRFFARTDPKVVNFISLTSSIGCMLYFYFKIITGARKWMS